MERMQNVFVLMDAIAPERFEQSQRLIQDHCVKFGKEIAAEMLSAFQDTFLQTAQFQSTGEKGDVRYIVLSHLYSSIYTGGYAMKLDIFDQRFYADPHEIDACLTLNWLHDFLEKDMNWFRESLKSHNILHLREYELEQIRYRYVYYYHAAALKLISESMPALLQLSEFQSLAVAPEMEVMYGSYMDQAVVIWPKEEKENEVFFA